MHSPTQLQRMPHPVRALALPLAALLLVALCATPVWAHATLQSAVPGKDAVVPSPAEVTLRFNEKLEPAFSKMKIVDVQGKPVVAGSPGVDRADHTVMKASLPVLVPGRYVVQYVAVGVDGHRRAGDYGFTVKH